MSGADFTVLGVPMSVEEPFSGQCPVQATGTIGERGWYFRARGQHWSVTIGALVDSYVSERDADLDVIGPCDDVRPYSAGYMKDDESERHLRCALHLYVRGIRGVVIYPDPPTMLPPCGKCGATTADRHPIHDMLPWCAAHEEGA